MKSLINDRIATGYQMLAGCICGNRTPALPYGGICVFDSLVNAAVFFGDEMTRRFEKVNLSVSRSRSTRIRSFAITCPLATRFDKGDTRKRSTERLR